MRGWGVCGLAIVLGLASHTPAAAQTRAELVEWLFRTGSSSVDYGKPDGASSSPISADYTAVAEKECVVTIEANYRGAVIIIDFNKMIAPTLQTGGLGFGSSGALIAGQSGFVSIRTFRRDTGAPLNLYSAYITITNKNDVAIAAKFPVVLRHFVTNHCPGTKSVL